MLKTCSRANVPCVLTFSRALRAYVLKCQRALRANWQLALCAHVQKVSTGLFFVSSGFFLLLLEIREILSGSNMVESLFVKQLILPKNL